MVFVRVSSDRMLLLAAVIAGFFCCSYHWGLIAIVILKGEGVAVVIIRTFCCSNHSDCLL